MNLIKMFDEMLEALCQLGAVEGSYSLHSKQLGRDTYLLLYQNEMDGAPQFHVFKVPNKERFVQHCLRLKSEPSKPLDAYDADDNELIWELLVNFYTVVKFDDE